MNLAKTIFFFIGALISFGYMSWWAKEGNGGMAIFWMIMVIGGGLGFLDYKSKI